MVNKFYTKTDIIRIDGIASVANNFTEGVVIETDGFVTDWTELDDYYKESLQELKKRGEAAFCFKEMLGAKYQTSKDAELGHKRIINYIKKYGWNKFKPNSPKFVKKVISGELI